MTGRAAFATGFLGILLAGLALWTHYGTVDWHLVGVLAPVALVVLGAGMLLLSRRTDRRPD